jgi:hypothetical protein
MNFSCGSIASINKSNQNFSLNIYKRYDKMEKDLEQKNFEPQSRALENLKFKKKFDKHK